MHQTKAETRKAKRSVGVVGSRRPLLLLTAIVSLASPSLLSGPAAAAGAVNFESQNPISTQRPISVASADFDGDADPDLVAANGTGFGGTTPSVSAILGQAGASFAAPTPFFAGNSPGHVAIGDFNGDADPDLAVANAGDDTVSVLPGRAGGAFRAPTAYRVGPDPRGVAIGDFNGDADPDLAVATGGGVAVLLGGAGAGFGAATFFPAGGSASAVVVGDFNGDSDPDLAVANESADTVSVLLGGAGGTFSAPVAYPVSDRPVGPQSIAVGDFNGDADPDLVAVGVRAEKISVLLGQAGGSFAPRNRFLVGGSPISVAIADFNGDSDPDLAVTTSEGLLPVLLGGAGGSFGGRTAFVVGETSQAVAAEDFNGDGAPDLAVTVPFRNTIAVLLNSPVSASPNPVAFPVTVIGSESAPQTVVLTNNSQEDVAVSGVSPAGAGAGGYFTSDDTCSGAIVPAAGTCSVTVRFRPDHVGFHRADLEFAGEGPEVLERVPLSGFGSGAVIFEPASLDWAPQPDSTSRSRKLTLRNATGSDLTVAGVALAGADVSSFRLPAVGDDCTGATVATGETCAVEVRFRPDGVGPKTARLDVTDDTATSPHTIALSGTGTPGPWLTQSVQGLKFGHVRVGDTTATKQVTLTNTGSAPMEIGSIALEGANTGDFVDLDESCTALAALGPDESCSAAIAFRPSATGHRQAHLSIEGTAPRSPFRVDLRGTGT